MFLNSQAPRYWLDATFASQDLLTVLHIYPFLAVKHWRTYTQKVQLVFTHNHWDLETNTLK